MKPRIYIRHQLVKAGWGLPIWVPWRYKWIAGLILFFSTAPFYYLPNHLQLFQPRLLPLTPVDSAIPFLPWTIWFYLSLFVFIPATFFVNRCIISMNKHLYSF